MLHVFKHSKFISHAMASRHPGETGKKPEPEQESKRACSQKTRITAHGAPPQKLKPEPFPSFPRPVLHRIRGGHPSRNHGVHWAAGTYCLPNREHMPEKNPGQRPPVSRRARGVLCPGTPLRGNKGEENDGEGEKNQCRARQLVGDMPSNCLNEREKEF